MDPHAGEYDFDDAEDFDDPDWDSAPAAAPHPSVAPKPAKSSKSYADPYGGYDDHYDYGGGGYAPAPSSASPSDVSLPRTKLFLRANRLQQLGKNAGEALRCDLPFSQISQVELRFAPGFADLLLVFFFAGLTVALLELLPGGWLRGILAIIAGLFAAGMLFGVVVTRTLRLHTAKQVLDIVIDDDVREAEAFAASLRARLDDHHTGPFR